MNSLFGHRATQDREVATSVRLRRFDLNRFNPFLSRVREAVPPEPRVPMVLGPLACRAFPMHPMIGWQPPDWRQFLQDIELERL